MPPFAIDAMLVFPGGDADDADVKTLQRSGRPVLNLAVSEGSGSAPASAPEKNAALEYWLSQLSETPRTNYHPINCNFYDNFEAAVVQKRCVVLEYRSVRNKVSRIHTRLNDLTTHRTEEYVQLANGEWLRLDRIISIDGKVTGNTCRF